MPTLAQIIGRIRRSQNDAAYAVNWVKHFGDDSLVKHLVHWAIQTPHAKLLVGDNPSPKEYSEIHSRFPRLKCSSDWRIELRWHLAILAQFTTQLREYVALRAQFGRHFLLGEYRAAEEALENIESKISKSLWSLDKRILLYQYRGGFSANKEYLGNLHDTCRNQYVNLLALFFSIRVERTIDLLSYQHLVDTKLSEIIKIGDSPAAAYLRSVLDSTREIDPDYTAYILYRSNDASIIDRLNGVTRFLRQMMLRPNGQSEVIPYQAAIGRLANATAEPSLSAINRILAPGSDAPLPEDYGDLLAALDLYTQGNYVDAIPKFHEFIANHPAAFFPYLVCAKSYARIGIGADPVGEPLSTATQILDSLTRIMLGKGDVREHIIKLSGIAVDLGENHLAFGLIDFVSDLLGNPASHATRLSEFAGKFPNPVADSSDETGQNRLARLLKAYPDSATLRFLDCRARHELTLHGGSLSVSPARLAFYTAEEQIRFGTRSSGISTLEAIYHAAMESEDTPFSQLHQVAVALFEAYVGDGSLTNACELACRSYTKSEIVPGALDLKRLLEALRDKPLQGIGTIYTPIITFLSDASEFEIYKALDRFLRSHSCKRMSEILAYSEYFPPEAFAILCGEVMSEDVMALGWRYVDDFAGVEAQRVELCAYLVSADAKNAKRYAEEAKAITKRQSVRRTLQHVSATKLRIDWPRLKRLYKDALEPIYIRRRLFITAEENNRLVQIETGRLIRAAIESEKAVAEEGDLRPEVEAELSQESQNLLGVLLDHCYALFLWGADCSLNFLLSGEVRHGFLKNHLRKPFQTHNVILSKVTADGEYRSSDYWSKQLDGNVSNDEMSSIEAQFREFSARIDDLITTLNDKVVQIKVSAAEKERLADTGMGDRLKGTDSGYFDYTSFFPSMFERTAELDAANTFDAFSDIFFGELERLTERNLSRVESYFRLEVPQAILEACDSLVEGLREHINTPYLWTSLLKAVQDARDGAISEANEIAGWFQPVDAGEPNDANLGEIADVVATLLRSCHPKTLGSCSLMIGADGDRIAVVGKAFSAVFDILYILVQNVAEHANLPAAEVGCVIRIWGENGRAGIEVSNNVVDAGTAERNVSLAHRFLNDPLGPAAEGEGRSGLRKINRRLLNAVSEGVDDVRVSSEGRRFVVRMMLPYSCTRA